MSLRVGIVGTGYVGLTTGICLAHLGHQVTCLDVDAAKIAMLASGKAPFYEPFLEDMLRQTRLEYSQSYEATVPNCDVIFIAVGTPSRADGSPNLDYLNAAATSLGQNLGEHFTVIVNKSTVPIGSGNWVESIVREAFVAKTGAKAAKRFAVASNPEFLREGSALHDSLYPDRVVLGSDSSEAIDLMYRLYRPLLEQKFASPSFLPRPDTMEAVPLIATDLASAELIKYAANAFLALKISYINEIGLLAQRVGADVRSVAKGIGLDARIGTRFLQAGLGWGGSCFGKDTSALVSTAQEYGLEMPIVKAARQINARQREQVVERLLEALKILKGRTVGLLGLAFKPNTDDLRDAPALDIARRLIERGAKVKAHDPVAVGIARERLTDLASVQWCDEAGQVADEADALVLVTEWHEYRDLDWAALKGRMRGQVIVDGRHFLDRRKLEELGFQYYFVG